MAGTPRARFVEGGLAAAALVLALSLPTSGSSSEAPSTPVSVPLWEVSAPVTALAPTPIAQTSQAGATETPTETKVAPPAVVPAALPQYLAVLQPDGTQLLATSQQIGTIHVGTTNGHWDSIDPSVWNQAVYWDTSALPGTDSAGTTYVYGHACKHHTCPFTALGLLNPDQLKQLIGGKIVVHTSRGTLTYTIDTVGALPKSGSKTLSTVDTSKPGNRFRIVLCEYDGFESLNNYYVEGIIASAEG